MKTRQLIYNLTCNYCGTYYQLNYDTQNDEYICKECLEAETNALEYSDNEDDFPTQEDERKEQRYQDSKKP